MAGKLGIQVRLYRGLRCVLTLAVWLAVAAATWSFFGVDFIAGSKDGGLYAFNASGKPVPGFPIPLGAASFSSPLISDLDHDGFADVVIGAADGLHIVRGVGSLGDCPWPMFRQDSQHLGRRG